MSYQMYEMAHLALLPARMMSDATRVWFKNPLNPAAYTPFGRNMAASAELFERMTRRYGKPVFGFETTVVDGVEVTVHEEFVWERPFCKLLHFRRDGLEGRPPQPKLLIVAPMSGHYATLLRGTTEAFLPHFDVYITDWADARMVPKAVEVFDLDDYIDYVMAMCRLLGRQEPTTPVHTLAVCQPAVPVLAAVARMEAENDPLSPASMTLMGGPIDTRRSPTAVNKLAEDRGTDWFRQNCLRTVPFPYPGMGRSVYPGFLQLSGFMAMNLDRHVNAHFDMFKHLVQGDGDSADKHREFYDEYMAVMDLTAEFYMQTIETVFVRQALPKGEMTHRGKPVDPTEIRHVGLLTIEGEKDDISGLGQTEAAQDLCINIPAHMKKHHVQMGVGHYGVFNGSRFRAHIVPMIVDFARMLDARRVPERLAG
ncbi:polyhydroxyalkanoate depolymerase [Lichenifustis flavocetrariae]|uniref:Polyhydroxyalkanoate depolymerase n=1 Tax=Lichenifustis flavocetrariae TaxID=2949735 RepID=A0AA41YTZ6_9HYPH|nr:polyhydroxyalkanoate depolymerase [Lichenifustis flavocetrariae]MCW6506808.1 polyhydroxyalkanoate depolymerase [Lichenifustis flavocetrariae]